MEIYFYSRLMFISAISPLVLCRYKFVLNLFYLLFYFFLAGLGVFFVFPDGLYKNKCTSDTYNHCLRTFEAEIVKTLKNIQPRRPKIRRSCKKSLFLSLTFEKKKCH